MGSYIGKHRPAIGRHHIEHGRYTTAEIIAGIAEYPITAPLHDGAPGGRHEYNASKLTLRHIEQMARGPSAPPEDTQVSFLRQRLVAQSLGWLFTSPNTDDTGYVYGTFYNLLPRSQQPNITELNIKLAALALEDVRTFAYDTKHQVRVVYCGDFRHGFIDVADVLGSFIVSSQVPSPGQPGQT